MRESSERPFSAGREKTDAEEYYDTHARTYSPRNFSPDDIRNRLYFADQITWHYLKKYSPKRKAALILDAGAGTGDWALLLVKRGYRNIVLTDISQGMLNEARTRFANLEDVAARFVKSDISDLRELQSETFDFVFSQYDSVSLSLKPREAVRALARVARRGAHVIVSLDVKYGTVPWLISEKKLREARRLLNTNIVWYDHDYPSYSLTWEELAEYFKEAALEVVEVIGVEVFTNHVRQRVLNRLKADPGTRKALLKMELDHCTERSLVNMAGHLQMVGRKS